MAHLMVGCIHSVIEIDASVWSVRVEKHTRQKVCVPICLQKFQEQNTWWLRDTNRHHEKIGFHIAHCQYKICEWFSGRTVIKGLRTLEPFSPRYLGPSPEPIYMSGERNGRLKET